MATEWCPVADWVGAAVTFLGFVGAIAALRVQRKSVAAQLEQHNKTKEAEEAEKRRKLEERAATALEEKEKDARAVELAVFAGRRKADPGSQFVNEPPFVVTCRLIFPRNIKYADVEFKHPDKPDGFTVSMDDFADTNYGPVTRGARIFWQISGAAWPLGNEDEALAWAKARTFATFTDSSSLKWKLDGHEELAEVTQDVEVEV
ncbi:hypothetical protein [Arthrobacter sp. ok362]|uniref:hypothetical protein n=1 Tax=Arthrobacter sp. ok362 TaxID=1761745 RepID=UPI00088DA1C4|nr:hypothetical protein [Arthrobacter sp. ok362]SDL76832.1 hypothetical protein SAMN04487913_11462 [Arthrobacter sp. ok362]